MSELRVDNIVSEDGSTAPVYSKGMTIGAGQTLTCSGDFTVGGDVTFNSGATVTGVVTFSSADLQSNLSVLSLNSSGIVTASSFSGDGSNLTGIDATSLKDSGGNVKIQANTSGVVFTGIATVGTALVGVTTGAIYAPGSVVQVRGTQYGTPTSISMPSGGNHYDVPFSVDITPVFSNSIIYVSYMLHGETGSSGWDHTSSFSRTISAVRTVVLPTVAYGSRNPGIAAWNDTHGPSDDSSTPGSFQVVMFPDTGRPANTNTITYTPTVLFGGGSTSFYLNRTVSDGDNTSYERFISSITVMEVAV